MGRHSAAQCGFQVRGGCLDVPVSERRQDLRIGLARNQGFDHATAGHVDDVADHQWAHFPYNKGLDQFDFDFQPNATTFWAGNSWPLLPCPTKLG